MRLGLSESRNSASRKYDRRGNRAEYRNESTTQSRAGALRKTKKKSFYSISTEAVGRVNARAKSRPRLVLLSDSAGGGQIIVDIVELR